MACKLSETHADVRGCTGPFWRHQRPHGRAFNASGAVRQGGTALEVIDFLDDFADVKRFEPPNACGFSSSTAGSSSTDTIEWLRHSSSRHRHVALSVDVCAGFAPTVYGHVWSVLYAFFCWLVRPYHAHSARSRREARDEVEDGRGSRGDSTANRTRPWTTVEATVKTTVYLPSGSHLGHGGARMFAEVPALFSSAASTLSFERGVIVSLALTRHPHPTP